MVPRTEAPIHGTVTGVTDTEVNLMTVDEHEITDPLRVGTPKEPQEAVPELPLSAKERYRLKLQQGKTLFGSK